MVAILVFIPQAGVVAMVTANITVEGLSIKESPESQANQ